MVRNQSGTATLAGSTIQLLFRLLTGLFPVFAALALVGCGSGNSGGAGNTPRTHSSSCQQLLQFVDGVVGAASRVFPRNTLHPSGIGTWCPDD